MHLCLEEGLHPPSLFSAGFLTSQTRWCPGHASTLPRMSGLSSALSGPPPVLSRTRNLVENQLQAQQVGRDVQVPVETGRFGSGTQTPTLSPPRWAPPPNARADPSHCPLWGRCPPTARGRSQGRRVRPSAGPRGPFTARCPCPPSRTPHSPPPCGPTPPTCLTPPPRCRGLPLWPPPPSTPCTPSRGRWGRARARCLAGPEVGPGTRWTRTSRIKSVFHFVLCVLPVYGKPVLPASRGQHPSDASCCVPDGMEADPSKTGEDAGSSPRPLSPTKLLPFLSNPHRSPCDVDLEALRRRLSHAPRPLKKRGSITEPEGPAGPNIQKLLYQKTTLAAMETVPVDTDGSFREGPPVEDSVAPPPPPPCSPDPAPCHSLLPPLDVRKEDSRPCPVLQGRRLDPPPPYPSCGDGEPRDDVTDPPPPEVTGQVPPVSPQV